MKGDMIMNGMNPHRTETKPSPCYADLRPAVGIKGRADEKLLG